MSRDIERLRESFVAASANDFEPLLALLDDDVELQRARGLGTIRGKAAVKEFLAPDAFEYQRVQPTEFRVRGDKILVYVDACARGKESGIEVESKACLVHTMRNGKAVRIEIYFDEAPALEAAGLEE